MAYTPNDAKANMDSLIAGLQTKFDQLDLLVNKPGLSSEDRAKVNSSKQELLIEISQRQQEAAFNVAAATVIRPPTAQEVTDFQKTLTDLGKSINTIATVEAVITFVDDVLTQNSQRFIDIAKTIRK